MKTLTLTFILMAAISSTATFAADRNTYSSQVDKSLTIHRVGVLPPTDNVNGLYSRYVEAKLIEKIKKSHRFDIRDLKDIDGHLTLEDYEEKSGVIKKTGELNKVEAMFSARVNKSKENLTLIIDLFLTSDGFLFAQEQIELPGTTGTDELGRKTADLYDKLLDKIPYRGLVLSREGNRVTIDLGKQDGIKDNAVVNVVQVIGLKRHPKFHFVISSDKIVLGKARVVKADDTLSFGVILQETDRGVIAVDSKLTGIDFVAYPDSLNGGAITPMGDTVSFGKNPKEWTPKKQPGFGKVGLELGLGSMHNAVSTQTDGARSTQVVAYPLINLSGELWLTPTWFIAGRIEEGIMSMSNPMSGSAPGTLSASNSHYAFHGGYKFFIEDDSSGPQIDTYLGLGEYNFFVDTSTPTAFTSLTYYGLYFGINGSLPVNKDKTWYITAALNHYFSPGLNESPVSSGTSSNNSGTEFLLGGARKMSDQLWITGKLDFEFYGSTFSGQGTRIGSNSAPDSALNSSHSLITLLGGIEYTF